MSRILVIYGWARHTWALGDSRALRGLLSQVCEAIGMRELDSCEVDVPVELERAGKEPIEDEGGATAVIVLSTSHAAIHGWPERPGRADAGYFEFCLHSCRDFEPGQVHQLLAEGLDICTSSWHNHQLDKVG